SAHLVLHLRPFSSFISRHPPRPPPFPYTTLFRSRCRPPAPLGPDPAACRRNPRRAPHTCVSPTQKSAGSLRQVTQDVKDAFPVRSEEHTSELQSRENLVCRLLLEKKKENYVT